jgi:hypothetical protein
MRDWRHWTLRGVAVLALAAGGAPRHGLMVPLGRDLLRAVLGICVARCARSPSITSLRTAIVGQKSRDRDTSLWPTVDRFAWQR